MSISKIVAYVLETLFKKKKTPPFRSSGDGLLLFFPLVFQSWKLSWHFAPKSGLMCVKAYDCKSWEGPTFLPPLKGLFQRCLAVSASDCILTWIYTEIPCFVCILWPGPQASLDATRVVSLICYHGDSWEDSRQSTSDHCLLLDLLGWWWWKEAICCSCLFL